MIDIPDTRRARLVSVYGSVGQNNFVGATKTLDVASETVGERIFHES